jgi:hypothetical protein
LGGRKKMNKKIISLVVSLVFVLGLAAVSSAQDWAEFIYGGYVSVISPAPVMVLADTGIWVFNPNASPITCKVSHLINKYGVVVRQNQPLYDGGQPISSIPAGGHGWTTLGQMLAQPGGEPPALGSYKLTYRIVCSGQAARVPVVEVKEVIYSVEQIIEEVDANQNPILNPMVIKTWAETALGGPTGPGKYKP